MPGRGFKIRRKWTAVISTARNMDQKYLFHQPASTRTRATDPPESVDGAVTATASAALMRGRVLLVADSTPRTANELAQRAVAEFGGIGDSYRKRAMELGRDGTLQKCERRICHVTGSNAGTFKRKES